MSNERFGIGGDAEGGVWTPTPLYLDSLVDTVVDSPTDGFVLTYEASSGKWKAKTAGAGSDVKVKVYEGGVQVGAVARFLNFDSGDFNITEDVGNDWFLVEAVAGGMTAHDMTGAYHTEDATGAIGNVIRATGLTTFAWAQLGHGDLGGVTSDLHHAQVHTLATTGDHSGELPLTDLAAGTQGSIIKRGMTDWEELVKGTTNYALVAGATDISWAQYDYTWLASIPSTFAPSAHGSSAHTGTIFAGANDSFGAFYLDIDDITVPTDPATSIRRLFVNTATGKLSVRTNASTTISLEEQGGTDADAIHDNVDAEISAITEKTSPVGADVIVIEDSAVLYAKKRVQITNLPGGADADAIHDNVSNEIQVITTKASPAGADVIIIEDSASTWAKKSVAISNLPAGSPSFGLPVSIDIGDSQAEGTSGDSARADHQHQFAAPGAGYPLDVANAESDGVATTPARSDHIHAHGTITSANAHRWNDLAAMPDTTTTTIGKATPTAVVLGVGHNGTVAYCNTFHIADHAHTTTVGSGNQIDYTDLTSIPSSFTPEAHVLGTSGPHSGTLPLTDLAVGSQGSIIRRGGADWEEYTKGTLNHALVCTATDAVWAQYDYSWLASIPSTFAPTSHGASDHTGDVLPAANQDLGTYYLDIDDISAPANPASTIRRLFVNTATGKLSVRTDAGVNVSLEEQGGGVTWGAPTGNIDIGDSAVEGTSSNATRADHQHAFTAPTAGYPQDIAATELDGTASTPARSDHVHAHGSGYSADAHHAQAHALATTGDHTGELPLTDLAAGTQGSIIKRGVGDWEELLKGTDTYVLKSGAADLSWGTVDWTELTGTQPAPVAHVLATSGPHTGTLPAAEVANGTQYQYLQSGATTPEWQARKFTISATLKSPAVGYTTVWRAPIGCTCTKLEGRQKGGTSTVINARYNGTTDVATADLTLTAANQWYSTTGINQTAWVATDWLEIEVQTLGSATEITFVLTFTEP